MKYLSISAYSYDSLLKSSGVKLELITCPQLYEFYERAIRGGLAVVCGRFEKCNNLSIPDHDPNLPFKIVEVDDINGCYAWALSQPLPTSVSFCSSDQENWLRDEIIDNRLANVDVTDDISYTCDVSIYYDPKFIPYLANYPPIPVKRTIDPSLLSNHTLDLLNRSGKAVDKSPRLLADLESKRITLHSYFLKSLMEMGVEVTELHRASYAVQSSWVKDYVDENTRRRSLAKDDFLKSFYKLKVRKLNFERNF